MIGSHGQKSVANLLTKRVEEIVATYDRHHRTEGFLMVRGLTSVFVLDLITFHFLFL